MTVGMIGAGDDAARVALCCPAGETPSSLIHDLVAEGFDVHVVGLASSARQLHRAPLLGVELCILVLAKSVAASLRHVHLVRSLFADVPVLVLCPGMRDFDQLLAFEMGADEVLSADVDAMILGARLRALQRRARLNRVGGRDESTELRFGPFVLCRAESSVRCGEERALLSGAEFDVLWLLASRAGESVTRAQIALSVCGVNDGSTDRYIDTRIYRVRRKLEFIGLGRRSIRTIRHRGYVFAPPVVMLDKPSSS